MSAGVAIDLRPADPTLLRQAYFIGGRRLTPTGTGELEAFNPSTGDVLARVSQVGRAAASTVEIADAASRHWRILTGKERSVILRRWFDLMEDNSEDLTRLIMLEEDKPFVEAKAEVAYAASFIGWFAEQGAGQTRAERRDLRSRPGSPDPRVAGAGRVCAAITCGTSPRRWSTAKPARHSLAVAP